MRSFGGNRNGATVVVDLGKVVTGARGSRGLNTVVVVILTTVEVVDEVLVDVDVLGERSGAVVSLVRRLAVVVEVVAGTGATVVVVGTAVVVVVVVVVVTDSGLPPPPPDGAGAVVVVVVAAGTTAVVVKPAASLPTES